jgi:copper transport protein
VPDRGAQLDAAPGQIELRFSESVQAGTGSVRVFDGAGKEVQDGQAFHPRDEGERVGVRLRSGLPEGGYTATYRVVSADSHPVSGGFSFSVGEGGPGPQSVDTLLEGTEAGPVTNTALGVARGVQYAAIALAVGLFVFLWWCWRPRSGWEAATAALHARGRRLLLVAGVAGVIASVTGIVLEGAQARGSTFWQAIDADVLGEVLDTRFGVTWLAAGLAWLSVLGFGLRRPTAIPLALLCLVPAFGGHASVESNWMLFANVIHVVAISAWIGGLAVLVTSLRSATGVFPPQDRTVPLTSTAGRFSALAGVAVAVVLATGIAQSIIELSAFDEFFDSAYGRSILIKLGLFLALLAFGLYNRARVLPRLRAATGSPGAAGVALRRTLRCELAIAIVVLGVTGALATYPPGKVADVGPVSASAVLGPARMELTVDPARTGSNELHIYLFERSSGTQWERAKEVSATATRGSVALPVELRRAGPGHYVAQQATFPTAGDWRVRFTARVSDFDQYETTVKVPIRKDSP